MAFEMAPHARRENGNDGTALAARPLQLKLELMSYPTPVGIAAARPRLRRTLAIWVNRSRRAIRRRAWNETLHRGQRAPSHAGRIAVDDRPAGLPAVPRRAN